MLGAVALALFLLFFGEFVGGISAVLMGLKTAALHLEL
jgi:hypothetical protein